MPSAVVKYPADVYGQGADAALVPLVVDYCVANATVTAGDVVIADTGASAGKVIPALTNSGTHLVVGIAKEGASAAGEIIPVVVAGRCQARIATTVTAGDRLTLDSTNAARLASVAGTVVVTQVQHLGIVIAVAEANAASALSIASVRIARI